MDRQTSMNDRNATGGDGYSSPEDGMRGLAHDIAALTELQGQLFAIDARDALRGLILPIAVITAVVGLVLGSVMTALTTFAYLLIELAGWPHYGAFLAATGLGLAGAGALLWALRRRWQNRPSVFARSSAEFRQNYDRVKQLLVRSKNVVRPDQSP